LEAGCVAVFPFDSSVLVRIFYGLLWNSGVDEMIRKVVEYMIICDAGERCVVDGFGHATAFGSPTQKDCAEQAAEHGWRQISVRRWLCPDCVNKIEKGSDQ
jgi:hypothetical protein